MARGNDVVHFEAPADPVSRQPGHVARCGLHNLSNTGARTAAPNVAPCLTNLFFVVVTKLSNARLPGDLPNQFELGVEFVSISPPVTKEKPKRVQINLSSA